LKHRRLLIGSIITIPIGFILWQIIGPIVALVGVTSRWEGWWIFGHTVTEVTTTYWIGVTIWVAGLIILIAGVVGLILAFVLEILDRQHKTVSETSTLTTLPKPSE